MAFSLEEVFDFAPIAAHRRARFAAIKKVLLSTESSETTEVHVNGMALRYAIIHHLIEGAERVAKAFDATALTWYRTRALREVLSRGIAGPRDMLVITLPSVDAMLNSSISDTPYYLLNETDATASPSLCELVTDSLITANDNGFGLLLSQHASVICLLAERRAGEYLNSWTITRLPGTVFLDYVRLPTIVARDLIHEAGHNWLNDALTACKISLEGVGEYYSPWKRSMRSTFGFLHACWAFPLTVIFSRQMIPHTDSTTRQILSGYLMRQQELLLETSHSHKQALRLLSNDDLRERLRYIYELAATG